MILGECFKEQGNANLEQILITWHPLCHMARLVLSAADLERKV